MPAAQAAAAAAGIKGGPVARTYNILKNLGGLTELEDNPILHIRRRGRVADPVVERVLEGISANLEDEAKKAVKQIAEEGGADTVEKVTARLNRAGLSDAARVLLSQQNVYPALIHYAIEKEQISLKDDDVSGLFNSVVRNLEEGTREEFEKALIREILEARKLPATKKRVNAIWKKLEGKVSFTDGNAADDVVEASFALSTQGDLPDDVRDWATRSGIADKRMTDEIVEAMVTFLQGLNIDFAAGAPGQFDALFALAYANSTDGRVATADPIVLAGAPGSFTPWDFRVDRFETAVEQGVVKSHILAAGALDYLYNFDQVMGVFRLADALVVRWASGLLDITSTQTSNKLYQYWKMRDRRITQEERAILYRRVLDKGDAEVLSRMVVNESFPRLWHNLMNEVTTYVDMTADAAKETAVSKIPIYRATQDLQFNLTDHATGMVQMQVSEIYSQFEDAIELFSEKDITDQLSAGLRKNLWAVIERLSREEFNASPDVSSIRTLSVEGNKVFEWIANFDQGSVTEDEFLAMLDAAQNWIIAAAAAGEGAGVPVGVREEMDDEFGDEFGDEFADEEEEW